ncbi:Kinesin-like protein KIF9 [Harpegnathos saltator]|uniref:Kinesin-like protein KIF9 n=1 Tax=Harpegnathos saltator TaxID=610380 RepID=E2C1M0_HARSA|nr:Kinesin-like protein KIF9 [Harpegnathos saltator]
MDSHPIYWTFPTDGIFHEASQDRVYRTIAKDLLEKGIAARLLSDMFAVKANRRKFNDIRYRLSFVELRGKQVVDLLAVRRPNVVNVNVGDLFENITAVSTKSEPEALRKLFEGEARRSTTTAASYPVSHLGTAVITFHVSNTSLIVSQAVVATAKIHIVEMAGIGTVGKSSCTKTASDVGMANLMKTQLEQYFWYLREPSAATYSVARSNLLRLLKNEFTVTSIIRFIAHVRVTREDLIVTLSTMRLAMEVARLKPIKTVRHVQPQTELILQRLQEEVNELRKELLLNDMFLRQEALMNISKTRIEQIGRDITNFLKGSISELTLFNVTQAQILVKIVKQLYNKLVAKEDDEEKLSEACEDVMNSLMPADTTLPATLLQNAETFNAIDSSNVFDKREDVTSQMYTDIDDKQVVEEVGILNRHGVSLRPVMQMDDTAMRLKYPIALQPDELQTVELTYECQDKTRRTFRQLQRIMERTTKVKTEVVCVFAEIFYFRVKRYKIWEQLYARAFTSY